MDKQNQDNPKIIKICGSDKVLLGRTGLEINRDAFGALPLQRAGMEESEKILRRVLDAGINYIDTARAYTDSEKKISAVSSRRGEFILATKTQAAQADAFWKDLETSLGELKTDYIDVYQFHNPSFCPRPEDGTGLYEAMLKAKQDGKIRFIAITNHRMRVALEAVKSGLYDLLQFPFCYLSDDKDEQLVNLCADRGVAFIAMKALSGGLITDIAAARSWFKTFPAAIPIWGIQRESELDELFAAIKEDAGLDDAKRGKITQDRAELSGAFCRGCAYCMPCPAGIAINMCARMSLLLRRFPSRLYLTEHWQNEMAKIPLCQHCGHCSANCPYGLQPETLLPKNYEDYQNVLQMGNATV
jgi:aryl-alcohol dehydrogenase-like predicted oxidoreductase